MMGAGSPECKNGVGIHMYAINKSMATKVMCNSDGDFLIVPQQGTLRVKTEFGVMQVPPGYCCVVQRYQSPILKLICAPCFFSYLVSLSF